MLFDLTQIAVSYNSIHDLNATLVVFDIIYSIYEIKNQDFGVMLQKRD